MQERVDRWRGEQIKENQIRINDQTQHMSNPVARQRKMAELEKSMLEEFDTSQKSIRDQFKNEESELCRSGKSIDLWGNESRRWALFVQLMDVITIRSKCSINEHVAQFRCPSELDLKLVADHCWLMQLFVRNRSFFFYF